MIRTLPTYRTTVGFQVASIAPSMTGVGAIQPRPALPLFDQPWLFWIYLDALWLRIRASG
jgi:hypothetical protein